MRAIMKRLVNIREVNQQFTKFVDAATQGDEIIITRRGVAVARLVGVQKSRQLSPEQKAAWKRIKARMKKGYDLGGEKFDRDKAHER